jgi:hypothetical protein
MPEDVTAIPLLHYLPLTESLVDGLMLSHGTPFECLRFTCALFDIRVHLRIHFPVWFCKEAKNADRNGKIVSTIDNIWSGLTLGRTGA